MSDLLTVRRGALAATLFLTALTAGTHAAVAASGTPLAYAQIADINRPGTVLVKTVWTSTIQVGRAQIQFDALVTFAKNQAALGLIPANSNAMVKAIFDELLEHPLLYLKPSGEPVTKQVQTAATGSGFVVTPDGYLITNAHVVYTDEDTLKNYIVEGWHYNELAELVKNDFENFRRFFANTRVIDAQAIEGKMPEFVKAEKAYYTRYMQMSNTQTQLYAAFGAALPGLRVLANDIPCELKTRGEVTPGKDVAVLKVEQNDLPTVELGDDSTLRVGDSIVVLGYPGAAEISFMASSSGVESTLTQGNLSARMEMPGGWTALQTSAEINHGNSGGPAFNDRGQVIGLATFGSGNPSVRGINFLVPISVAKEFLNELNVKPRESRLSELYRQGLEDVDRNCYRKALDKFKEIGDLSPGFPFLQDKIMQSRNAIDQGLDRCWMPSGTSLYVGVAAAVVILIAGMLLLVPRLRPAPALAPSGLSFVITADAIEAKPEPRPVMLPPAEPPPAAVPRSSGSLQCNAGALAGKRYEITKKGLMIGRDATRCQIVLVNDAVSKEHAWIVPLHEGVAVLDRGSTNGTYVNSLESPRISKVLLAHGDRVYIGKGLAVFTYHSS